MAKAFRAKAICSIWRSNNNIRREIRLLVQLQGRAHWPGPRECAAVPERQQRRHGETGYRGAKGAGLDRGCTRCGYPAGPWGEGRDACLRNRNRESADRRGQALSSFLPGAAGLGRARISLTLQHARGFVRRSAAVPGRLSWRRLADTPATWLGLESFHTAGNAALRVRPPLHCHPCAHPHRILYCSMPPCVASGSAFH